jgi:superfamily II DNA/RNA helicase
MLAHLTDTAGVVGLCGGVRVLILDEADRLLDMGFKR